MPTEPSTYKVVADVIVSPTDSIVIGVGPETTYLHSVSAENEVATIGDLIVEVSDTAFTIVGGAVGTEPTFDGDPLFSGSYVRHGDIAEFQIQVEFDNITNFGSGQYYIDLPFPSKYAYQFSAGCLHDISTSRDYPIFGHVAAGASRMFLKSIDASGNTAYNVPFSQGSPVTLDVADNFHIAGNYVIDPEA